MLSLVELVCPKITHSPISVKLWFNSNSFINPSEHLFDFHYFPYIKRE
uniref:Uncharacterized protein n=1 Tax=Siphoviridae sp. ctCIv11 TaxID=2827806 RepID=A0A8S5S1T8_9CAUD|nr:MAG TPA: hypothetical protein [Siphoviridae sp. ctCIv11]